MADVVTVPANLMVSSRERVDFQQRNSGCGVTTGRQWHFKVLQAPVFRDRLLYRCRPLLKGAGQPILFAASFDAGQSVIDATAFIAEAADQCLIRF